MIKYRKINRNLNKIIGTYMKKYKRLKESLRYRSNKIGEKNN